MNLQTLGRQDRSWGYEIVWASNEFYCGKILVFEKAGSKTAKLIHKEKKKSWFINAGRFKFTKFDKLSFDKFVFILFIFEPCFLSILLSITHFLPLKCL